MGHVPSSSFNCLTFLLTSEPHKLWHCTLTFDFINYGCIPITNYTGRWNFNPVRVPDKYFRFCRPYFYFRLSAVISVAWTQFLRARRKGKTQIYCRNFNPECPSLQDKTISGFGHHIANMSYMIIVCNTYSSAYMLSATNYKIYNYKININIPILQLKYIIQKDNIKIMKCQENYAF